MATIFEGCIFNDSPYPYARVQYEYKREGADMLYYFSARVWISATGGYYRNNIQGNFYLNGTHIWSQNYQSSSKQWNLYYESGWHRVSNKTSGTTPFSFTFKDTQNSSWVNYSSGQYNLSVSPAYTSITTYNPTAKDETSINVNWDASNGCDAIQYSLNNGSWIGGVGWPNMIISGLTANTTYNVKIRVKRTDSQLWTESSNKSVTTYNYPYVTATPSFTIGQSITFTLYNPLSRECQIKVMQDQTNNLLFESNTFTGNSLTCMDDTTTVSTLYNSIPNAKSSNYKVRLIVTDPVRDTTINGGEYKILNDSSEEPIFTNSNVVSLVNGANTDISGTNKFIYNHNLLSITISPMTTQKGAEPDYYTFSANGMATKIEQYSDQNITVQFGNMITDIISITAVDKRGLSKTITANIDLVSYNLPYMTSSTIRRQNGIGQNAIVHFEGMYTDWPNLLIDNDIITWQYRYKERYNDQAVYTNWKSFTTGTTLTASSGDWEIDGILDDTFEVTKSYIFQLKIEDKLETFISTEEDTNCIVSTAEALLWRDLLNKRIGINKKPLQTFDVNGGVNMESLYMKNNQILWYTNSEPEQEEPLSQITPSEFEILQNQVQQLMVAVAALQVKTNVVYDNIITEEQKTIRIEGLDLQRDKGYEILIIGTASAAADLNCWLNNYGDDAHYWAFGYYRNSGATSDYSDNGSSFNIGLRTDRNYWYYGHALRPRITTIRSKLMYIDDPADDNRAYPMYQWEAGTVWTEYQNMAKSYGVCTINLRTTNVTAITFDMSSGVIRTGTRIVIKKMFS